MEGFGKGAGQCQEVKKDGLKKEGSTQIETYQIAALVGLRQARAHTQATQTGKRTPSCNTDRWKDALPQHRQAGGHPPATQTMGRPPGLITCWRTWWGRRPKCIDGINNYYILKQKLPQSHNGVT